MDCKRPDLVLSPTISDIGGKLGFLDRCDAFAAGNGIGREEQNVKPSCPAMAVLDFFEADIRVNRKPLPEYENNDSNEIPEERKIIKYVEAPTGAAFSIYVSIARGYQMISEGIRFSVWIDGKAMAGKIVRKKAFESCQSRWSYVDRGVDIRVDDSTFNFRPYVFTKIDFGDTDQSSTGSPYWSAGPASLSVGSTRSSVGSRTSVNSDAMAQGDLQDLGTITVKAYRIKNIIDVDGSFEQVDMEPFKTRSRKLKRKLKDSGITQNVTLGAPSLQSPLKTVSSEYVDGKSQPIATFVLKYRTKEALELLLVIPSADPLLSMPIEDLSREQSQELHRRLRPHSDHSGVRTRLERISRRSAALSEVRETPNPTASSTDLCQGNTMTNPEPVPQPTSTPSPLVETVPRRSLRSPKPPIPAHEQLSMSRTPPEPVPGRSSFPTVAPDQLFTHSVSTPNRLKPPSRRLSMFSRPPVPVYNWSTPSAATTGPEPVSAHSSTSTDLPEPISKRSSQSIEPPIPVWQPSIIANVSQPATTRSLAKRKRLFGFASESQSNDPVLDSAVEHEQRDEETGKFERPMREKRRKVDGKPEEDGDDYKPAD
ncbi:MAG: hypothetical protein Q9181_007387, partial [Wetmoreana brouardii]